MNTYQHFTLKERGIIMPNPPGMNTASFTLGTEEKRWVDENFEKLGYRSRAAFYQAACEIGLRVLRGDTQVVPQGAPVLDEQERTQVLAIVATDPLIQMALDLITALRGEVRAEVKAEYNGHEQAAVRSALEAYQRNLVAFLPEIEAK